MVQSFRMIQAALRSRDGAARVDKSDYAAGCALPAVSRRPITELGTAECIFCLPGFPNGSTAVYGVTWSTDTHNWVVLEMVEEDGDWRGDSWRGWIPSRASEGEIPYNLFEGTDTTNLFPP